MLIFSRRETEQICLGEDIVLTVVKVAGDKVRVGVKAPPHVTILRNELEKNPDLQHASQESNRSIEVDDIEVVEPSPIDDYRATEQPKSASTPNLRVVSDDSSLEEETEAKVPSAQTEKRPGPLAGFRRAA